MSGLAGTWTVVRIGTAATAEGAQGRPSLTFEGDGQVFGYGGVNRLRGTWTLDVDRLAFGPVVATRMAGPDDVTATETALLALLARPARLTLQGGPDHAVLHGVDGTEAELVREVGA
ncbi:META domain-containing protein [Cellulomonas marina]|uniref:META domain-containing protein n=1 Tax=Cellulomonas marina TaxID=988821 RepID=A0A1I0X053_9CELL|nr:META domain-containing protein [Cellulomonas marina]GIG29343.1 hypothetical protein Cma02nite_19430 [Cellulomonas marina]SFA94271.1 META domain-containing protein [Cellulomonas marina]